MKLSIQVEHLSSALSKTLSVIDRKNPRVVLTYCLFTAEKNQIFLEATDLEVSARAASNANIEKDGQLCINPRSMFDLVKEMPNRTLYLETIQENNLLRLTNEQVDISLLTCSPEEFPRLSFSGNGHELEIKGKDLLTFINKTSYAIGHDETRIFLNGIFLQQINNRLRAVATNGYTFALIESEPLCHSHDVLSKGIIIPKKGVIELKKIAEQNSDINLKIFVDESFMYVNSEDHYHISIRLITREYPPYEDVIPKQTSYSMAVSREHLINAIRRIKVLANERSNAVKFSLSKNNVIVSANHPLLGEAAEKININYDGKNIDMGFNARYIIDSLSALEDDEAILRFNGELSPVIIESKKMQEFLGIVMPLKL